LHIATDFSDADKSTTLPETLRKGVEALVAFNAALGLWVPWIHIEPSP
jgi:hypothetical protein